jgi:hypothetical protein
MKTSVEGKPFDGHGARAAYQRGCRCLPCRVANAAYQRQRRASLDDAVALVSSAAAVDHLAQLALLGVGYRQAARLSGLSIAEIRVVRKGRRAYVRADTAARILSVRPVLAPGQRVSAWPTWRLIHSLTREGFTLGALATRLGLHTPHLQFDHTQVTVRNALRVRRLYELVNLEDEEIAS